MACLRRDLSGKPWGKKLIMTSKGLHSTLSFEDFSVGFGWWSFLLCGDKPDRRLEEEVEGAGEGYRLSSLVAGFSVGWVWDTVSIIEKSPCGDGCANWMVCGEESRGQRWATRCARSKRLTRRSAPASWAARGCESLKMRSAGPRRVSAGTEGGVCVAIRTREWDKCVDVSRGTRSWIVGSIYKKIVSQKARENFERNKTDLQGWG